MGLVPLPAPPVPVTLKYWRENTEYQTQSTETTMKHGKSQMLWRNGRPHSAQTGGTYIYLHPPRLQDRRKMADPVCDGVQG